MVKNAGPAVGPALSMKERWKGYCLLMVLRIFENMFK